MKLVINDCYSIDSGDFKEIQISSNSVNYVIYVRYYIKDVEKPFDFVNGYELVRTPNKAIRQLVLNRSDYNLICDTNNCFLIRR